jgi:hypothetical protein
MGDEGKLYVPPELVSVYREKVTNPVDVVFVLGPYDTISFSLTPSQLYIYIYFNNTIFNKRFKKIVIFSKCPLLYVEVARFSVG